MRISLQIKSTLRSPIKTLIMLILITVMSFGLFSRVNNYISTLQEFQYIESTFQGVGTVDVSPPDVFPVASSTFLTGMYFNPDSPSGTWEHTRYQALPAEIISQISKLTYVTSTDIRYMTAGIHNTFFRLDDRQTFHNYTHRVIVEATLLAVNVYATSALGEELVPYVNRNVLARFTNFTPLTELPEAGRAIIESQAMRDFTFISNFRGNFPSWVEQSDIDRITANWNSAFEAQSNRLRASHQWPETGVSHDIVDELTIGERYVLVARFDLVDDMLNVGCNLSAFWVDSLVVPSTYSLPEDIQKLIEITNTDLRTFDVVYTNDMASISRFAHGFSGMAEGRKISPADYGTNVAVISHVLAEFYNLSIGDTISLGLTDRLHNQHAGLGAVSAGVRGRFATPIKYVDLEIVGIYVEFTNDLHQANNPHWSYSSNTIFVPTSLLPIDPNEVEGHRIEPSELSFVIGNIHNVRNFRERYAPFIENELGLRLTLTDSGWSEIETDFLLTQRMALLAILALVLTMVAAIVLVVFLFVIQRKKEYAIMRATGCSRYRASMSLFLPLFLLGVIAIAIGGIGAWFYVSASIATVLVSIFTMLIVLATAEGVGLAIVGRVPPLVLLQGGYGRRHHITQAPTVVGETIPPFSLGNIPVVTKTQSIFFHSVKYVFHNIWRSKVKSLLLIFVSATLFVSLGQFIASWQAAQVLYDTIPVNVIFFDRLTPGRTTAIEGTGLVHDPYLEFFGGRGEFDTHPSILRAEGYNPLPTTFVISNDFERFLGEELRIEFLPEYDMEAFLNSTRPVAVLFGSLMDWDFHNTNLSDNIELSRFAPQLHSRIFRVVGRVSVNDAHEHINTTVLIPPGISHQELFFPGGTTRNPTVFYDIVEFTITYNYRIDELRTRIAAFGVERNEYFIDTYALDRVGNNLKIFTLLFPIIAVVLAIISGLFPGLMILQTAKEAALLRIMGTTKSRTGIIVAGQHLLLCFAGLLLGAGIVVALNGVERVFAMQNLFIFSIVVFVFCYVLGVAISVVKVIRPKVLQLLQVKE